MPQPTDIGLGKPYGAAFAALVVLMQLSDRLAGRRRLTPALAR
jgi:hypothetical protein